jgi:hypothetical protein
MQMKIATQRVDHGVTRKTFDGLNVALVTGDGQHQARPRRLTVDKDCASTADAMLAAQMGSSEIPSLPQEICQRRARRNLLCDGRTIDAQTDRCHCSTC